MTNISKKVSLKLYFAGLVLVSAVATWYWLGTEDALMWLGIFLLSMVINHYMLVEGLSMIVHKGRENPSPIKVLSFILGKTIVLGAGIFLVIRFAPHNIYTMALLYLFQLMILFISIKKDKSYS